MIDKETQRKNSAEWYKNNKERASIRGKAYYQANKEKIKARERAKRLADPELYRKKNRERLKIWRASKEGKIAKAKSGRGTYQRHPEIQRRHWLKKKYGITIEQFDEILKSQNGVCAICKNGNDHLTKWGTKTKRMTVDHNHKTGKVRGLLCHKCNAALGRFKEKTENFRAAILYLESHG